MKRRIIVIVAVLVLSGAFLGLRYIPAESVELSRYETATFAGGCFWCMEAAFESVDGVVEAVSGYTGGTVVNPTYEQVSRGGTGHLETVQVYHDPAVVSYDELLDVFWRNIDPTDDGGQFVDRGGQYKTAIFYHDLVQKALAEASREELGNSGRFDEPVVSGILEFMVFYEAEEYHQDYYKKNVLNYKLYSSGSGRESFIEEHWGE
jgi:peptide methionine sulfoxide reductase msrA/msrB